MDFAYNIYMDCCSLNRPYDNQLQDKIRMESNAAMAILFKCFYNNWKLIGSDIIYYEINKTPDIIKRNNVLNLYSIKKSVIALTIDIQTRAIVLQDKYKLKPIDRLHFTSAESWNADVLLTTDRVFMNRAKEIKTIRIENPVNWFMEVIDNACNG
jgi:predicted nucleic acid-binding protein